MNKPVKTLLQVLKKSLPFIYLGTVISLVMCGHAFADDTDYLKGADTAVTTTFGENSTFIKIVYVAEVIGTLFAWFKTKSPYVLIGLPVLLIATHVLFKAATGA